MPHFICALSKGLIVIFFSDSPRVLCGNTVRTNVFKTILYDFNTATLGKLLSFCIHTMVDPNQAGSSVFGYKIFIQLLARINPDIDAPKLYMYKVTIFIIELF